MKVLGMAMLEVNLMRSLPWGSSARELFVECFSQDIELGVLRKDAAVWVTRWSRGGRGGESRRWEKARSLARRDQRRIKARALGVEASR